MNRKQGLLLAAALAALPGAHAATASGSFQVTATVVSACTVSGTVLNFGAAIAPLSASVPIDATSTLTIACTNTTPYAVALDAGIHAGGAANFTSRAILNGASSLGYQLYLDSGRATVWGDGTATTSTRSGTGTGGNQSMTVYGRLPSVTGAVPGTFTDTVTVTITY